MKDVAALLWIIGVLIGGWSQREHLKACPYDGLDLTQVALVSVTWFSIIPILDLTKSRVRGQPVCRSGP